ncbi:DNA-directed RNA polymerase I and III subunit RPAC1 [Nematocida ausubeli]|uniref:DNA-directed RNA polymerase I and III subunit RPAC1 n=1 Tax=Nematocida ausubeli (strain ATCC PRA-371 / ERTm2) TaxID=1913371 RepID=H8ZEB8_NEMA1|nr:DNA-directed RNA polymerase I and III subunit RPAC1 [Nematocida ausubeli]
MDEYLARIEVRKVADGPDTLSFRVNQIEASVLNALRRTIISDTPSIAVHWVYIRENETVMADEILSHRLGLIPILADSSTLKNIVRSEVLDPLAELTDENSIKMELNVENTTDKVLTVRSNDIKIVSNTKTTLKQNVIITRLAPGKRIECKMLAVVGTGREHAKWMPTSVCYYRSIKKLEMKDISKAMEIQKYFRDGFAIENGKPVIDEDRLLVNMDIEKNYPNEIKVRAEPDSFFFEIEAIANSPKSILKKGLGILKNKLKEFQTAANAR